MAGRCWQGCLGPRSQPARRAAFCWPLRCSCRRPCPEEPTPSIAAGSSLAARCCHVEAVCPFLDTSYLGKKDFYSNEPPSEDPPRPGQENLCVSGSSLALISVVSVAVQAPEHVLDVTGHITAIMSIRLQTGNWDVRRPIQSQNLK